MIDAGRPRRPKARVQLLSASAKYLPDCREHQAPMLTALDDPTLYSICRDRANFQPTADTGTVGCGGTRALYCPLLIDLYGIFCGGYGPCRSRTYDQEIKSLLLYQLS